MKFGLVIRQRYSIPFPKGYIENYSEHQQADHTAVDYDANVENDYQREGDKITVFSYTTETNNGFWKTGYEVLIKGQNNVQNYQDSSYFKRTNDLNDCCVTWMPLQKIDKQIGPLNLIPSSHLLGDLPFNRRQKNG